VKDVAALRRKASNLEMQDERIISDNARLLQKCHKMEKEYLDTKSSREDMKSKNHIEDLEKKVADLERGRQSLSFEIKSLLAHKNIVTGQNENVCKFERAKVDKLKDKM
jgi:predicted RNase H-like nuclease (RuvC/YqgF family)